MWGILTNMVSTRRSSARLQEKQESAPSSPVPAESAHASPATRLRRATTSASAKATPPSATRPSSRRTTPTKSTTPTTTTPGSGGKRGRPSKSAAAKSKARASDCDDTAVIESDAASENRESNEGLEQVQKQLFTEQEEVAPTIMVTNKEEATAIAAAPSTDEEQTGTEEVEEQVEEEKLPQPTVKEPVMEAAEVEQEPEAEEEEEIVMMEDSDDANEDEAMEDANAHEDEDEDENDDDVDILEFAKMAAAGISLSTTSGNTTNSSTTTPSTKLVPDTLDSGASQRTKFLHFEGSKLGHGAKVVTDTAAVEEQKVLASQLGKVAKANRQREEATNDPSAGRKWFGMKSQEMDPDARRDFALLRMRNYLDPKKFYKSSDHNKKLPSHFQFGTVIEGAHEFKSARLTKKERKQTFTEEIMADEGIRTYTKRVFLQVQASKAGQGKKKKQKRF